MFENRKIPFRTVWGVLMTFVYLGLAYATAFTPLLIRYNAYNDPRHDDNVMLRTILGIVFFVYAVVRGYNVWQKTNRKDGQLWTGR